MRAGTKALAVPGLMGNPHVPVTVPLDIHMPTLGHEDEMADEFMVSTCVSSAECGIRTHNPTGSYNLGCWDRLTATRLAGGQIRI